MFSLSDLVELHSCRRLPPDLQQRRNLADVGLVDLWPRRLLLRGGHMSNGRRRLSPDGANSREVKERPASPPWSGPRAATDVTRGDEWGSVALKLRDLR